MGLDCRAIRQLANLLKNPDKKLRSCICLGRPNYMGVDKETRRLCADLGIPVSPDMLASGYREGFADPFLRALGLTELTHLDVDGREGAQILHDLNNEIPREHWDKFDLVLDNGTLEHVYNLPMALKNCIRLVKPGGYVVVMVPANNQCGHGFVQLSPEMFYRTFSKENGFDDQSCIMMDCGPLSRDYVIHDPATAGHRHVFFNSTPVVLYGQARKVESVEPFKNGWPQQSDCLLYWNKVKAKEDVSELRYEAPKWQVFLLENFPRFGRFLQGFKFSPLNPNFRLKDF